MKVYSYTRFSTPEQMKGDSLRRQTDDAQAYCQRHGLVLDESLSFRDLGISAFHGKHAKEGELGDFLKLVESGTIEKGSILLVENLDRLSREDPLTALFQLRTIVSAGINVVTLTDNKTYSIENITEIGNLITGIVIMSRANEESKMKRERGKAAWENKRTLAKETGKPLTKRCPLWLKYEDGKFIPIPEVVDVIRKIYEMRLNGLGVDKIAIILNQIPDIWKPEKINNNHTGGWTGAYIKIIIHTRAVLGEFQAKYRDNENKSINTGEPIINYYPAIIDTNLFNAVQNYNQKVKLVKSHYGGNSGKAYNLFAYTVKCGICGNAMHYISKHNHYLHCDTSRRKSEFNGIHCKAKLVHYDEVQRFIFADLEELDINSILSGKDDKQIKAKQLEKQIDSINFEVSELARKMNNLTDTISNEDNPNLRQALKDKWTTFDLKQTELIKQSETFKYDLLELQSNGKNIRDNINNATEVYNQLISMPDDDKAIEVRIKLRTAIRKIVKEIQVYPLDRRYKELEQTDEPGIMMHTRSKTIRKIRIRFNNTTNWRVLFYQSKVEIE